MTIFTCRIIFYLYSIIQFGKFENNYSKYRTLKEGFIFEVGQYLIAFFILIVIGKSFKYYKKLPRAVLP